MTRVHKTVTLTTEYWRPGENYLQQIVEAIKDKVGNQDIVVISEKAVSTALGTIVDESTVKPGWTAHLLAKYWMRYAWGYFLGLLCRLRDTTIQHIRE